MGIDWGCRRLIISVSLKVVSFSFIFCNKFLYLSWSFIYLNNENFYWESIRQSLLHVAWNIHLATHKQNKSIANKEWDSLRNHIFALFHGANNTSVIFLFEPKVENLWIQQKRWIIAIQFYIFCMFILTHFPKQDPKVR